MLKEVAIIGTHGLPPVYGGFETWCHQITQGLSGKFNFTVIGEKNSKNTNYDYSHLNYREISFSKSNDSIFYYLHSLYNVRNNRLIIIVGLGAALWIPIFRLFYKSKIYVNIDGLEWKRAKWKFHERLFLRFSEWLCVIFSNKIIVDSIGIKKYCLNNYPFISSTKYELIEYGSEVSKLQSKALISEFDNQYYLLVARIVPENNIDLIINAFIKSKSADKLYIVGALDNSKYCQRIKNIQNIQICFLGSIYDQNKLLSLRQNALAAFHGHSVGGTNPSLLEAMSCRVPIFAHDNEFNKGVLLESGIYFSDLDDLVKKINNFIDNNLDISAKISSQIERISNYFSHEIINAKYETLFDKED